jgi:hypothetical protein
MHIALSSFTRRLAVIDNLVADHKAVALCKKELHLVRVVMNSTNWPGTGIVKGTRKFKTSPGSTKLSMEDKLVFFDVHTSTLKSKMRSFEKILAIIERRQHTTLPVSVGKQEVDCGWCVAMTK